MRSAHVIFLAAGHAVRSELGRHVGVRVDDVTAGARAVSLRVDVVGESAATNVARRRACAERVLPEQDQLQRRGVSAEEEVSHVTSEEEVSHVT